jgi:hypothetical protein
VQTHPAAPASPTTDSPPSTTPNKANLPGFKDPPPGKRRVAPEPTATESRAESPAPEAPKAQLRTPSPEEVENDPLVKSVLDVFEGEIKRVHPKNN